MIILVVIRIIQRMYTTTWKPSTWQ